MTTFKKDEIIFLIGAGISVEAGIPTSNQMVERIEDKLKNEWKEFRSLYNFIKSAIHYADGLNGRFNKEVQYNIERLVNTLDEIDRKTEHPLYPFVGAWNAKLVELGGDGFQLVRAFKNKILEELKTVWLSPRDNRASSYFRCFSEFLKGGAGRPGLGYPIRAFTLNYDLCLEQNCGDLVIERGFTTDRTWDWRLFDLNDSDPKDVFLYKLHGSIDWHKGLDGSITYVDNYSSIPTGEIAIIFGTNYKLQYVDPFLFLAYEFRRWTLEARLIITIGYGFADEHINGIISQALKQVGDSAHRKLLVVDPNGEETLRTQIVKKLDLANDDQIKLWQIGAKDCLEKKLIVENLVELFPSEPDLFEEMAEAQ